MIHLTRRLLDKIARQDDNQSALLKYPRQLACQHVVIVGTSLLLFVVSATFIIYKIVNTSSAISFNGPAATSWPPNINGGTDPAGKSRLAYINDDVTYVTDLRGSSSRLTGDNAEDPTSINISPDGSHIAYTRDGEGQLIVEDSNGDNKQVVNKQEYDEIISGFLWFADSRHVFYQWTKSPSGFSSQGEKPCSETSCTDGWRVFDTKSGKSSDLKPGPGSTIIDNISASGDSIAWIDNRHFLDSSGNLTDLKTGTSQKLSLPDAAMQSNDPDISLVQSPNGKQTFMVAVGWRGSSSDLSNQVTACDMYNLMPGWQVGQQVAQVNNCGGRIFWGSNQEIYFDQTPGPNSRSHDEQFANGGDVLADSDVIYAFDTESKQQTLVLASTDSDFYDLEAVLNNKALIVRHVHIANSRPMVSLEKRNLNGSDPVTLASSTTNDIQIIGWLR